jgi:PAS domain S-box-containing protein
MPLKFKLSHQGLILVAVPLIFELIFVAILYSALQQAEAEIKREAHIKAVVKQINLANKRFVDSLSFVAGYCVTGKKFFADKYKETIAKLPQDFDTMKSLVAQYPKELASIEKLSNTVDKCILALKRAEELQEAGHRAKAYTELAASKEIFQDLMRETNDLSSELERLEKRSPIIQEISRQQIKQLLFVGIILNIFIAIFLALYFNKWTTQRLKILMDNTTRLAREMPLNPPIKGSDEIAQLDKVFNSMALALAESTHKEREITKNAIAAEASIRHIIESMPVGLIIISETGIIEQINPKTEEMFGCQFQSIEGQNLEILFKEESGNKKSFVSELTQKALGHIISKTALDKDGKTFPVDLSITEFNSPNKQSYLAVIIDVSERHAIEKLKQEFVAMVSHELRTPLTSVQGFLGLLKEGLYGNLNDRGQKTLLMADRNIGRLMNLIKDLLDAERLESGIIAMQQSEIEISSIIEKAIESVRNVADKHKISIEFSSDKINLFADGDRLVQVLINFLSNAIKFSPEERKITINTCKIENKLEVRVTDQGRGIPNKYHDSIFERFQQVDFNDSKQKGGTGLGLAICKAIITQHNGIIGVDSTEGKGASFWFQIPLALETVSKTT